MSQFHVPVDIVLRSDPFQVGLDLRAAGIVAAPLGVILEGELVGVRGDVACDSGVAGNKHLSRKCFFWRSYDGVRLHTHSQTTSRQYRHSINIASSVTIGSINSLIDESTFS